MLPSALPARSAPTGVSSRPRVRPVDGGGLAVEQRAHLDGIDRLGQDGAAPALDDHCAERPLRVESVPYTPSKGPGE